MMVPDNNIDNNKGTHAPSLIIFSRSTKTNVKIKKHFLILKFTF